MSRSAAVRRAAGELGFFASRSLSGHVEHRLGEELLQPPVLVVERLYPLNVEDALGGAMATGEPRVGEPERAVDQAHGTRTEAVAVNHE
jgi:hypothetical protein